VHGVQSLELASNVAFPNDPTGQANGWSVAGGQKKPMGQTLGDTAA